MQSEKWIEKAGFRLETFSTGLFWTLFLSSIGLILSVCTYFWRRSTKGAAISFELLARAKDAPNTPHTTRLESVQGRRNSKQHQSNHESWS